MKTIMMKTKHALCGLIESKFLSVLLGLVIALGLMASHGTAVMAQEAPPAPPGIIQGTGTTFAVTDSDYLNVSVVSTAEIDLHINSAPTIINMTIAASAGATSTEITLGGLEANTTYWMYQDASVDSVEFTTDASGSHTFTQDLTDPHSIRIQPGQSTVYIYDDGASGTGGNCTSVGTWDASTKTCTLTQNVNDSIYVYSSGVTLDGNGLQVNLPSWGWVQMNGSNHTLKDLTINGGCDPYYGCSYPTGYGIYFSYASNSTVTNVTVLGTYYGIYSYYSSGNLIQNSVFSGQNYGGYIQYSNNNTLSDNVFTGSTYYPYYGMYIWASNSNTLVGNTFTGPFYNGGVYVDGYDYSYDYWYYGYHYVGGSDYSSSNNTVYRNNFVNVSTPIYLADWGYTSTWNYGSNSYGSTTYDTDVNTGNVFNLSAPDGGNYYRQYDETTEGCDDTNSDGFCDSAFVGYGGAVDYLPWTTQDAWVNQAPTAVAGGPYLVAVGGDVILVGSASSDPDGDPLSETWTADGMPEGGMVTDNTYTAGTVPGIYEVELVVNDDQADSEPAFATVVVYDPSGGFVTGGGWIDSPAGAYVADELLTGKASFGFVSKYKKGASTPTGQTQFQFTAGDLNFHSDSYQWLVVNQGGTNAQYKGKGTVNGGLAPTDEAYGFMLWAGDDDPDTFRIRIWYEDGVEVEVYDNGTDQVIGGGSIVIHTGGKGGKN